jgi:DNA-binding response OmpR family regulator
MASLPLILLVEDDDLVRNLEAQVLRDSDYDVHAVATAKDARSHLGAHHYDLVLVDAKLGQESGFPIADEAEKNGIRAVVITGYGFEFLHELERREHLLKPIRPDELVRAIRLYLAAAEEC